MEPVKRTTVEENFKEVVEQAKSTSKPIDTKVREFVDPWMAENWPMKRSPAEKDLAFKVHVRDGKESLGFEKKE